MSSALYTARGEDEARKGITPDMAPVRGTQPNVPVERTQDMDSCEVWRKTGSILMCWRAFRPQKDDDPDVESMSSAKHNNIQVQIEMPRLWPSQGEMNSASGHVSVNASGTLAVGPRQ